jgi:hypothetical protein
MKNPEQIIDKLLAEHDFLKSMQSNIVQNYDVLLQNQRQNTTNHEQVIQNQSTIIHNQEIIVNNQMNIVRNQKQIVQNQTTLDVILQVQSVILNQIQKLNGQNETLVETEKFVELLTKKSNESLRFKPFNETTGL